MESKVYNQAGSETGKIDLPESIFGLKWNADLVHQVVRVIQGNMRTPVAHAKGRGEVRGGGKKPWQQKGTGRARHGSSRSPIWVGGGVSHGPTKDKVFTRKINKKVRAKAWATVISKKFKDGELFFLDALELKQPKTKLASGVMKVLADKFGKKQMAYKSGNRVLIALDKRDKSIEKAFRNIASVKVDECRNMNAHEAISYRYIIFVNYKHISHA